MVEAEPLPPLPSGAGVEQRAAQYAQVLERLQLLLGGEGDWVAAMATVACELHAAFSFFHWTGFYRAAAPAAPAALAAPAAPAAPAAAHMPKASSAGAAAGEAAVAEAADEAEEAAAGGTAAAAGGGMLVVGPYQGGLGCLRIPYNKGVCGAAARTRQTQLVPDVHAYPGHIACASSTQSEVVVPVLTPHGRLLAVLDVDSDLPAAFTSVDAEWLEKLCARLGAGPWSTGL